MALLWTDSFDSYTTITNKFDSVTSSGVGTAISITSSAGRRGTNGLRCAATTSGGDRCGNKTLSAASGATVVFGFSFHNPQVSQTTHIMRIVDTGTLQIALAMTTTNALSVINGSGTVLGTSAINAVSSTGTQYVEAKFLIANAGGTYEVRVNGVNVLSGTGDTQNTASARWTSFSLGGVTMLQPSNLDFDDLYLLDGTGSSPWTDFLGDIRVDYLAPTAEGTHSDWTPSTGSDNSATIDETAPNSDTDYNSTSTLNAIDTFVIPDLPSAGATIYGVQVQSFCEKADAGAASYAPVVRHSGTDNVGTTVALGTSYAYLIQIYQTNPGTSAQWTETDFNAIEIGYKKVV